MEHWSRKESARHFIVKSCALHYKSKCVRKIVAMIVLLDCDSLGLASRVYEHAVGTFTQELVSVWMRSFRGLTTVFTVTSIKTSRSVRFWGLCSSETGVITVDLSVQKLFLSMHSRAWEKGIVRVVASYLRYCCKTVRDVAEVRLNCCAQHMENVLDSPALRHRHCLRRLWKIFCKGGSCGHYGVQKKFLERILTFVESRCCCGSLQRFGFWHCPRDVNCCVDLSMVTASFGCSAHTRCCWSEGYLLRAVESLLRVREEGLSSLLRPHFCRRCDWRVPRFILQIDARSDAQYAVQNCDDVCPYFC